MALLKDGTRVFGALNVNTEIVVDNTSILLTLNTAFDQANSANTIAIAAFNQANLKLDSAGGIVYGDLTVTGNLTISGNTVFNNVTTYQIDDPLIYLAANNYTSDLVDIGFIANYVNTTGSNVHTGLIRDHLTKEYYLFFGYDKEPDFNHIDPTGNNFTIAFLNANIRTSNIILNNVSVYDSIQNSFDKANTANTVAFAAFDQANLANIIAISAFDKANAANAVASGAFDQANSAKDDAATAEILAISAFDKANIASQNAFGIVIANGVSLIADSNNDTLTIKTTGNIAITADASGDNLTFDLSETGVSSTTYGNNTIIPVFTVDSRGRLTSAANANLSISVQNSGNTIGSRKFINFIEGNANVTILIEDDSVGDRINVSISSSGSGGDSIIASAAFDQANAAYNKANSASNISNSIVYISDNAPDSSVANGFLWWNSSDGILYINYGDGDSKQWVVTNPYISAIANANTSGGEGITTGKAIAMAIVFGG